MRKVRRPAIQRSEKRTRTSASQLVGSFEPIPMGGVTPVGRSSTEKPERSLRSTRVRRPFCTKCTKGDDAGQLKGAVTEG
jgi:hypothetical protein